MQKTWCDYCGKPITAKYLEDVEVYLQADGAPPLLTVHLHNDCDKDFVEEIKKIKKRELLRDNR